MPFNMAMMGVGGRTFILTITSEDLAINYVIENELASAYPGFGGSVSGDLIQLTISGVDLVALNSSKYAIDGDSLHNLALLNITLLTGAWISGHGGNGGNGGFGEWESEIPADISGNGGTGVAGGTPIRLGCETNFLGTGTIEKGYGGGGGGGGSAVNSGSEYGGGGGGGGAPLGNGGGGGSGPDASGTAGTQATNTNNGLNGTGFSGAGDGGNGGDSGGDAAAGFTGVSGHNGGGAGGNGDAIHSQGFTHSEGGSITVTGDIT